MNKVNIIKLYITLYKATVYIKKKNVTMLHSFIWHYGLNWSILRTGIKLDNLMQNT